MGTSEKDLVYFSDSMAGLKVEKSVDRFDREGECRETVVLLLATEKQSVMFYQ